jgi:hypothetical protein
MPCHTLPFCTVIKVCDIGTLPCHVTPSRAALLAGEEDLSVAELFKAVIFPFAITKRRNTTYFF